MWKFEVNTEIVFSCNPISDCMVPNISLFKIFQGDYMCYKYLFHSDFHWETAIYNLYIFTVSNENLKCKGLQMSL